MSPRNRAFAMMLFCAACASSPSPRAEGLAESPEPSPEAVSPAEPDVRGPEARGVQGSPTADALAAFVATDGQPPRDRARVACERLLEGARFVGPETPRPSTMTERAWLLVHEPVESYASRGRELVFFADVDGAIVEAHADARTGAIETIPLASIAAEASEPTCEAPTSCGCFHQCAEVVRLGPDGPDARYRVIGTNGGLVLERRPQCYEGSCARVCDAPGHCVDGLAQVMETCTGSCAPDEAPFHCVRGPSGCERVDH